MKFEFVCYRVPESELSLAHPGESCGEDVSVSGEDGSHWPDPLMWSQTFLLASGGTGITTRATVVPCSSFKPFLAVRGFISLQLTAKISLLRFTRNTGFTDVKWFCVSLCPEGLCFYWTKHIST